MAQKIRRPFKKPQFFKVLLGDFKHRLKIPPNFVKYISEEASKEAIVQDPNGSSWEVQLSKANEGTFLSGGWPKFAEDHSLREFEFLVFRYDGKMHFSVQIFGTNGCEKEYVPVSKSSIKPVCHEERSKQTTPKKMRLDVEPLQKTGSKRDLKKILKEEVNPLGQSHESPLNSVKGKDHKKNARCTRYSKPSNFLESKVEIDESPSSVLGADTKQIKGYFSRRQTVTVDQRLKAQEAANSFRSKFPYFVARITEASLYKMYALRLPSCFSRAHLPRSRTNVVLRDPTGKAWIVGYIRSSSDFLSRGWSAFARGNKLEEGDFCVFELVDSIELHVHIFRAVKGDHTKN